MLRMLVLYRRTTAHAASTNAKLRLDKLGTWWFWALAALCAGGVTGFIMVMYACFTGSPTLYHYGTQATYISCLGVIMWRMKDALQAHLSEVMTSTSP